MGLGISLGLFFYVLIYITLKLMNHLSLSVRHTLLSMGFPIRSTALSTRLPDGQVGNDGWGE
jgi:hypothetical protein